MAETLDWPLVLLSPPAFLGHGIEGFENSADEVFGDLMSLRRAVVLFDECEEFFRVRPRDTNYESRTAGAFITSGMLPRLQDLRDRRWVIFVINTNAELEDLDPAVTRRGRLDFAERMDHPWLEAQLRYLASWPRGKALLSQRALGWFDGILRDHDDGQRPKRLQLGEMRRDLRTQRQDSEEFRATTARIRSREDDLQPVTFSSLDALAERCMRKDITAKAKLKQNFREELARSGPDEWSMRALSPLLREIQLQDQTGHSPEAGEHDEDPELSEDTTE